jgi:excisionase family DNA binding protein
MSDTTSDLLRVFVDANDDRKNMALQVLRGELTRCPYLRSEQAFVEHGVRPVVRDVGPIEGPRLMGMGAGAKYLGVSRATLWRACQAGRLETVELFAGSYRVRRSDLDALVAGNGKYERAVRRKE